MKFQIRIGLLLLVSISISMICTSLAGCSLKMPGKSFKGPLPDLQAEEQVLENELKEQVRYLSTEIGVRNLENYENLLRAEKYISNTLESFGYEVKKQEYFIGALRFANVWVEKQGTTNPERIFVVGAHYDSSHESPAANDNASGVAATLSLAKLLKSKDHKLTLRFVFFTNEEPPYFWSKNMGSLVYAKACKENGDDIVGMLSLETIGYYSEDEKSQKYPPIISNFYPSTGNFIAFVGLSGATEFAHSIVESFRATASFPSEGAVLPWWVPMVGASDHWSFWRQGYPALMVTDTAPFRYPYYHTRNDTVDKINFNYMARVIFGLSKVIAKFKE